LGKRERILVDNIPLKHFYDISNLISNTGGEESTDTDSDADLDEDTPINTRLQLVQRDRRTSSIKCNMKLL
jgi:hypothetical protein